MAEGVELSAPDSHSARSHPAGAPAAGSAAAGSYASSAQSRSSSAPISRRSERMPGAATATTAAGVAGRARRGESRSNGGTGAPTRTSRGLTTSESELESSSRSTAGVHPAHRSNGKGTSASAASAASAAAAAAARSERLTTQAAPEGATSNGENASGGVGSGVGGGVGKGGSKSRPSGELAEVEAEAAAAAAEARAAAAEKGLRRLGSGGAAGRYGDARGEGRGDANGGHRRVQSDRSFRSNRGGESAGGEGRSRGSPSAARREPRSGGPEREHAASPDRRRLEGDGSGSGGGGGGGIGDNEMVAGEEDEWGHPQPEVLRTPSFSRSGGAAAAAAAVRAPSSSRFDRESASYSRSQSMSGRQRLANEGYDEGKQLYSVSSTPGAGSREMVQEDGGGGGIGGFDGENNRSPDRPASPSRSPRKPPLGGLHTPPTDPAPAVAAAVEARSGREIASATAGGRLISVDRWGRRSRDREWFRLVSASGGRVVRFGFCPCFPGVGSGVRLACWSGHDERRGEQRAVCSGSRFGRGLVVVSDRSQPFRVYFFVWPMYIPGILCFFASFLFCFPFLSFFSFFFCTLYGSHKPFRAISLSLPPLCTSSPMYLSLSLFLSVTVCSPPSLFSALVGCLLALLSPPPLSLVAPFLVCVLCCVWGGHRRFRQVRPGAGAVEPCLCPEGRA